MRHAPAALHLLPRVPQQRQVGEVVLLEASLENATKAPMLIDTITFMPSPPWAVERIGSGGAGSLPAPVPAPEGAAPAAVGAAAADKDAGPLRWAAGRWWW